MAILEVAIAAGTRTLRSGCRILPGVLLAFAVCAQAIDEYQVKAAFLYNFARFVEWPPQTFKSDQDPVRICILGHDPFGAMLIDAVSGKTVSGRMLVISELYDIPKTSGCQILFIGFSEKKRLRSIFADLQPGILTVGETDGFAAQGGIVNFKLEDGRIRLEINPEAAGQAKLHISAKVLSLAQIIKTTVQK